EINYDYNTIQNIINKTQLSIVSTKGNNSNPNMKSNQLIFQEGANSSNQKNNSNTITNFGSPAKAFLPSSFDIISILRDTSNQSESAMISTQGMQTVSTTQSPNVFTKIEDSNDFHPGFFSILEVSTLPSEEQYNQNSNKISIDLSYDNKIKNINVTSPQLTETEYTTPIFKTRGTDQIAENFENLSEINIRTKPLENITKTLINNVSTLNISTNYINLEKKNIFSLIGADQEITTNGPMENSSTEQNYFEDITNNLFDITIPVTQTYDNTTENTMSFNTSREISGMKNIMDRRKLILCQTQDEFSRASSSVLLALIFVLPVIGSIYIIGHTSYILHHYGSPQSVQPDDNLLQAHKQGTIKIVCVLLFHIICWLPFLMVQLLNTLNVVISIPQVVKLLCYLLGHTYNIMRTLIFVFLHMKKQMVVSVFPLGSNEISLHNNSATLEPVQETSTQQISTRPISSLPLFINNNFCEV
ncbi:unnamed protein product, partial [Meganyctiphanes norvegica]